MIILKLKKNVTKHDVDDDDVFLVNENENWMNLGGLASTTLKQIFIIMILGKI